MFGFSFVPGSLIAFEKVLAKLAEPLADDASPRRSAAATGAVHADEDSWTLEVVETCLLLAARHQRNTFIFSLTLRRMGEVSRAVLGDNFTGTLVTDCYSGLPRASGGGEAEVLGSWARRYSP